MLYHPGTVLSGLNGVVIVLTLPLAQFLETGDIKKREMVERSSNDFEAPVVALHSRRNEMSHSVEAFLRPKPRVDIRFNNGVGLRLLFSCADRSCRFTSNA
jgi:hypothetical protein